VYLPAPEPSTGPPTSTHPERTFEKLMRSRMPAPGTWSPPTPCIEASTNGISEVNSGDRLGEQRDTWRWKATPPIGTQTKLDSPGSCTSSSLIRPGRYPDPPLNLFCERSERSWTPMRPASTPVAGRTRWKPSEAGPQCSRPHGANPTYADRARRVCLTAGRRDRGASASHPESDGAWHPAASRTSLPTGWSITRPRLERLATLHPINPTSRSPRPERQPRERRTAKTISLCGRHLAPRTPLEPVLVSKDHRELP